MSESSRMTDLPVHSPDSSRGWAEMSRFDRRTHPRYETVRNVTDAWIRGTEQGLIIGSRAQSDIVSALGLTDTFVRSAAMVMTSEAFRVYRDALDTAILAGLTGCDECSDTGHNVFIPCVNG